MSNTPAQKVQHRQGDVSAMKTEASPALKYWQNELAAKEETTKSIYKKNFADFLQFINKNPEKNRKPVLKIHCSQEKRRIRNRYPSNNVRFDTLLL
jgi:hypothetical protein